MTDKRVWMAESGADEGRATAGTGGGPRHRRERSGKEKERTVREENGSRRQQQVIA